MLGVRLFAQLSGSDPWALGASLSAVSFILEGVELSASLRWEQRPEP